MAVVAVGSFLAANAGTIAAATMAGQTLMQGVEARRQAEQQQQMQEANNKRAIESMQGQYSQLSGAEADARERAATDAMSNQIEAARRKSRINLMAAASGTQGLSFDSALRDIKQQQGRNLNTILKNQEIELQGFRNQAEQIRTGTAGRIDNRKVQRPSWLEVGLNTATSATQGYMTGQDLSASLGNGGNPRATLPRSGGFGEWETYSGGV